MAYDFEVDGIYYNISRWEINVCEVTYKECDNKNYVSDYTGNVTIPETVVYNGVTYPVRSIGAYAFSGCSSLSSVSFPESLTSIGDRAFWFCSSLSSVSFSESLTSIGDYAFSGCSSLSSVEIPSSVISIGDAAFSGAVDFVMLKSETPVAVGNGVFSSAFSEIAHEVTFVVPGGSVEAYREAWSSWCPAAYICSDSRQHDWEVTVVAEDNASGLLNAIAGGMDDEVMWNVFRLKISGTINSYDFMIMRNKMLNLRYLDLSEAQVVYNAYEHYQGYHSNDNELPGYAFYRSNLMECKLPKNLTCIGGSAFEGCLLRNIVIPESVEVVGHAAFSLCRFMEDVQFPSTLKVIEGNAFSSCSALKSIKLPDGVSRVEYGAFGGCDLVEVRIPSSIITIGDGAFSSRSLKDVYTYVIEPLSIGQTTFDNETYLTATLHIPETAESNYYWDTQWSQFQSRVEFNEPYEYFYLNKDLVMDDDTPRLEGEADEETGEVTGPDADLNPGSGLVVEGDEEQNLGDVHLKDDGNGNGSSMIGHGNKGQGNLNAKNVHIDIEVEANRWYFFCFPYEIDKTNIKYKGSYVLRYYDGAKRAENGSGGWTDWADDHLTAGVGYIFQGSQTGTLTFQIPDVTFDSEDREILLESHAANESQDAGWNFVGNPYTSYFDMHDLGYDYPITVWNQNSGTYEAFNPQDDEYRFHPYQAFFVQKPTGEDAITFKAEHRKTKLQGEAEDEARAASANANINWGKRLANMDRKLVNLTLSDGQKTDKTRVVFNNERRTTYEVGCDAAKFMADGVPQLYSMDGNAVKYAINERPEDNGVVRLGYSVAADGNYTIGLSRADAGVMLKDKLTGASHDFADGDYAFTSEAGTFDDRFLLVKSMEATGVNGVFAAGEAVVNVETGIISVYQADGLHTTVTTTDGVLAGEMEGNGSLRVRPGVYVVKVGDNAKKLLVK